MLLSLKEMVIADKKHDKIFKKKIKKRLTFSKPSVGHVYRQIYNTRSDVEICLSKANPGVLKIGMG